MSVVQTMTTKAKSGVSRDWHANSSGVSPKRSFRMILDDESN